MPIEQIVDFVSGNKNWLFSGIGTAAILGIFTIFRKRASQALKTHYKKLQPIQDKEEHTAVVEYLENLIIWLKEYDKEDPSSKIALEAVKKTSKVDCGKRHKKTINLNTIKRQIRMILEMKQGGDGVTARIAHLDQKSKIIKNIVKHLLSSNEPMVLLGDPGTGKSVTLRETAYFIAEKEIKSNYPMIPVFIKLDEVNFEIHKKLDNNDVKELVKNKLPDNLQSYFEKLLREKRLIIIFDGLDEMNRSQYKEYIHALSKFAKDFKDSVKTLFSCRLNDFSEEFKHRQLALLPFNRKQIIEYLKKNLREILIEEQFWRPKEIVNHLEKNPLFRKHISNPYFLRTFVVYIKEKGRWPDSLAEVYNIFFISYYRQFEGKQDKERLLGVDKAFDGWARIAYLISIQNQWPQINREKLVQEFSDKKLKQLIVEGIKSQILKEVLIDKCYYIAFVHHRFQEYFTARYLRDYHKQMKESYHELNWLNLLNVPHWQETFIILTALDTNFPGIKNLEESIRGAEWILKKQETENLSRALRKQYAEDERLLAERVLLASRIVNKTSKKSGSAGETLFDTLLTAIKVLSDKGRKTTQIMMVWACNYLEKINIYDLIIGPLSSDVKYVRTQALILVNEAAIFGRAIGPSFTFELCKEMASDKLFKYLPTFVKALFANFKIRNLWSLLFTTICALLTPAVILWGVYGAYIFLRSGNKLVYLYIPQVEAVFWIVSIILPIYLYFNHSYNYNLGQSILGTSFILLSFLNAAQALESQGFWFAAAILVGIFFLGSWASMICSYLIFLFHLFSVVICIVGTWPWLDSQLPLRLIINSVFCNSRILSFIKKYSTIFWGCTIFCALIGLIYFLSNNFKVLFNVLADILLLYFPVIMVAFTIIYSFFRVSYLIFKKIKQNGIKNILKLILGSIQKKIRAIFSLSGLKKMGIIISYILGVILFLTVILWIIPFVFNTKIMNQTPVGVFLLIIAVPLAIIVYVAYMPVRNIIYVVFKKHKKLSKTPSEWEKDFSLTISSPKDQKIMLDEMENLSHHFSPNEYYELLLRIELYIKKEPALSRHCQMLLSFQQEIRLENNNISMKKVPISR